jgi:hypothetical protein
MIESRLTSVDEERKTLEAEVAKLDQELGRLTAAIVKGGNLDSLVVAIKEREARKVLLSSSLEKLAASRPLPRLEARRWEAEIVRRLSDWRVVLRRHANQARHLLRTVLQDRLVFSPSEEGGVRHYCFDGRAALGRLVSGTVLPKGVVAPTGRDRTCPIQVRDFIAAVILSTTRPPRAREHDKRSDALPAFASAASTSRGKSTTPYDAG